MSPKPAIVERIRDAEPEEREALDNLQRAASMVSHHDRPFLIAHPDAIDLPAEQIRDRRVRVAIGSEGMLGFSVALPQPDAAYELDGLFVHPDFMGQGVGRELVLDVVQRMSALSVEHLDVTANPEALVFYAKMGFTLGEEVGTRFGPGHRMRLNVKSVLQNERR